MKILVTGKGTSGSWFIRGVQLGTAIGATVIPKHEDPSGYDLVVVVKKVPPNLLDRLHTRRIPWIWDVVDAWPQPVGNRWQKEQAVKWLKGQILELRPSAIVFPTMIMRRDSDWTGPCTVLPHHAWPKYSPKPLRDHILNVGYEGGLHYLGSWRTLLDIGCNRRGWTFSPNGDLSICDIGIALREYSGYPAKFWKSNCKLANLQALGVPAICSPERSYKEFGSGKEIFVTSPEELKGALDLLMDCDRGPIREAMLAAAPRLEDISKGYLQWLNQLNF